MKKTFIILFILLCRSCVYAQQGITFCLKGYESGLDSCCEHIIGDTVLWCNGRWDEKKKKYINYPDNYRIVSYDYGNCPPSGLEICRWVLNDSVPAMYKEWAVTSREIMRLDGDFPILDLQVCFICPNHKRLLPKYCSDVIMDMNSITAKDNRDTTNKYFGLRYGWVPKSSSDTMGNGIQMTWNLNTDTIRTKSKP